MKTIVVQLSDELWTMEAMHLASAMARQMNGTIVLLRLVLVHNPGLLGWGSVACNEVQDRQIEACSTIAEDYGISFRVQAMQYITLSDALAQAAEQIGAWAIFAHIPRSTIPVWDRFRRWSLKHQIHACHLYTLDEEQPLRLEEPMTPEAVLQNH